MDKDDVTNLHEAIAQQDAHHRLLCAIEGRPYEPPAERKRLDLLTEAVARGKPVDDALALFFPEGRAPESKAPAKRPAPPRIEVTQEIYEQLADACRR